MDSRRPVKPAGIMTPNKLHKLRSALPSFAEGAAGTLLRQYLAFYQLDFSKTYPLADYRGGLIPSGRYQLMAQRWLLPDARANLLLVHGYFDHAGLYDKLVDYGLSRQCNVLIFDLPGHGLSSGDPCVIEDFADYAAAVQDVLSGAEMPDLPTHVLAQSTGCAALTECARQQQWPYERAVFLAPLVRPAGWLGVRAGYLLLHRFTDSVARKFNRNSADEDFLEFVRRDPLQFRRVPLAWIGALQCWLDELDVDDLGVGPVQVIQGRRDGTVDWRYNVGAMQAMFPETSVHYLPDAGHQLANESRAIREAYYPVMDQYLFN